MTYLTALGSVLAIIAIVIVAGAIIAFLAKTIIGLFENNKRVDNEESEIASIKENVYKNEKQEVKTFEPVNPIKQEAEVDDDYSYALDVDNDIAKKEKEALEKEIGKKVDDDFFDDYKRGVSEDFSYKEEDDEEDEFDLMNMIDEISDDVLDNKKTEIEENDKKKAEETASILDKYSIDSILNDEDEDEEDEDDALEVEPQSVQNESVEEIKSIRDEIMAMLQDLRGAKAENVEEKTVEEVVEEQVDEKIDENLAVIEELKRALEQKEQEINEIKDSKAELENKYAEINKNIVEEFNNKNREIENQIHSSLSSSKEEISALKQQLEQVSKQLEEERSANWKVANKSAAEVVEKPIKVVESNVVEEVVELDDQIEEDDEEEFRIAEVKRIADEEIEAKVQERLVESTKVIEDLTKRVEELTSVKTETVETFQFSTEAQYLARIEVLEERLKNAKKDLKLNDKEYKPLAKVKKTLDRDKAKLRRKDAIAAKKKVALYGVNNYVDIDKEKAEKLAHELELLDGLKLSVIHCEEVMNANRERFPILEHTHNILTNNIADIEADLAELHKELKALRDKNDNE